MNPTQVLRRTFDALSHPPGSAERARLNCDCLTSQYMTGSPYMTRQVALMSDGSPNPAQPFHDREFKTKREAQAYADGLNGA